MSGPFVFEGPAQNVEAANLTRVNVWAREAGSLYRSLVIWRHVDCIFRERVLRCSVRCVR